MPTEKEKGIEKPKADFDEKHKKWRGFYEPRVVHPETGEEVAPAQLIQDEISDTVEEHYQELRKQIGKKGRVLKREDIEPHIYKKVEEAYLRSQGRKTKGDVDPETFKENAQAYFTSMAGRTLGRDFDTYEEAMEAVLEATNPIHGKEDNEKSQVLEQLLRQLATNTHEKGSELTKLERQLVHKGYDRHWREANAGLFDEYGKPGHKFGPDAESGDVMSVAREALSTERITGNTTRRKYVVGPDTIKDVKPAYGK